jgi:uncharacterized membrane protein
MNKLDQQSFFSLLLSHRPVDQWHLCYRFRLAGREWALCARCLGIFPAMALTFLVGKLSGEWPRWFEWAVLMLPPLPALVEWSTTAVAGKPESKNWVRLVTGIGMGMGIGGALYVNSYDLLNQPVSAQFLYVVATVLLVKVTVYIRFGIKRRRQVKKRLRNRPTLEEYIRRSSQTGEPGKVQRQ